ncbi:hypothetical protein PMAYCL1PPCAC_19466, partial [Pristionchus mayeri]
SLALASIVETPFGELEGFEHVTESGTKTNVFLGIRYARVDKHFEKPEMEEKWAPSRLAATEFGPSCYPYTESFLAFHAPSSEDCLFMNIITPSQSQSDKLPVFVFIHGGGFCVGASTHYGYKRLAERVAAEGIVVVTINYRLGPFGFFSLGDSEAPGSMGLWDLTVGLRFLNQILPSFGGDPSRITVSGHSAGSMAASALQYSPHSNPLFAQSILMSGSVVAEVSNSQRVIEESKKLVKMLGCEANTTRETLDCMQKLSSVEIVLGLDKVGVDIIHANSFPYQPRIDGDFFPQPIDELVRTAPNKIRSMSGVAEQEGALFTLIIGALRLNETEMSTYSRENLVKFIETHVVTNEEHGEHANEFRRLLVDFYVNKDEREGDAAFYIQRYSDLIGDIQYVAPLYREIQMKLANEWPSFLYILQQGTENPPRDALPVKGQYHGDELHYFSDNTGIYPMKENDHDFVAAGNHFARAIVNFVNNGDPSSSSLSWPAVSKNNPFQHASIAAKTRFEKNTYREGTALHWLETVPQSVPVELLRKSRLPCAHKPEIHTEL